MSDRRLADVIHEAARHFVASASPDDLAAFQPCGAPDCTFCEAADDYRAMRAMQSRTATKETR